MVMPAASIAGDHEIGCTGLHGDTIANAAQGQVEIGEDVRPLRYPTMTPE